MDSISDFLTKIFVEKKIIEKNKPVKEESSLDDISIVSYESGTSGLSDTSYLESVVHCEGDCEGKCESPNCALNITNNNLIISNEKVKTNINRLIEVLEVISDSINSNKIYNKTLLVITNKTNRYIFKEKILLENPYLYFNNIIIKNSLNSVNIPKGDTINLIIVDSVCSINSLNKYKYNKNVQLIILNENKELNLKNFKKV